MSISLSEINPGDVSAQRGRDTASNRPESVELHDVWSSRGAELPKGCCYSRSLWSWMLDLLIGVVVAVCAQAVHYGHEQLSAFRMYLVGLVLPGIFAAWIVNTLITVLYVAGAHACVLWQPSAVSGGIPGVIAFLNGVDLKNLFSEKILVAKVLGVICACGSSLAVGPEGPMIHIGAAAGVLVLAQCRRIDWLRRVLQGSGGSRSLELHAAAVGAGCGVTAAFWAPLAGTLFVVEEAATYLSPRFFVHVFGASCVSLGTVLLWQELWKHTGQYSPLFQVFLGPNCSYSEFIYYVSCGVIGLICGLLGCLFNRVVLELNFLRQRWRTEGRRNIFTVEVVVIAILSSSIGTLLPAMTTCRESTIQRAFTNSNQCIAGEWATQIFEGRENLHEKVKMVPSAGLFGVQYNPDVCPKAIYNDSHMPCNLEKLGLKFPSSVPEQERYFYCCGFDDLDSFHKGLVYNFTSPRAPLELFEEFWPTYGCETFSESNISIPRYRPMAALAFVPGRITVKNLFTRGSPNMIPTTSMLVFLPLYFVLAAITSGAAVPSGLVVPMMIIGGCVGRLAGNLLTKLFRDAWTCPSDWTPEYSLLLKMLAQQGINTSFSHACGLPDPGSFAIVGAAAFMSASGSIVLFVIAMMVEITGDIASVLPIAFGALTGRFVVRSFIGHGLYHDLMQITKLPFLSRECPLHAEDRKAPVAALLHDAGDGDNLSPLRYLNKVESRDSVEELLRSCSHNGFPIVSERGQLVGLVRRRALETWLAEGQAQLRLDTVADPAPYTVHRDFPVDRAYLLFRELGLRQLIVVDYSGRRGRHAYFALHVPVSPRGKTGQHARNLQGFGATVGCFQDDCQNTDKFVASSLDSCTKVCQSLPECEFWVWGQEEGEQKCWFRLGDDGREAGEGWISGGRACHPPGQEAIVMGNVECWIDGFNYDTCCDPKFGPSGNAQCWDGVFNYDRCCFPKDEL
ncbi:clcD [Symbiodinium natans]|uniref:ClcD protein n=1 Tax=Symbiodinium natans TaxID=878477 RepID=A0A812PJZ9_9DINO|nr:clcD [Symbiodinium natans]